MTGPSVKTSTRLALRSPVVRRGVLMLAPACVRVLGGQVPALLEREQAHAVQVAELAEGRAEALAQVGAAQPVGFLQSTVSD